MINLRFSWNISSLALVFLMGDPILQDCSEFERSDAQLGDVGPATRLQRVWVIEVRKGEPGEFRDDYYIYIDYSI